MDQENLFEIEMVQDTSLEAARLLPIPDISGGGGQSNSNCSSYNAADMP